MNPTPKKPVPDDPEPRWWAFVKLPFQALAVILQGKKIPKD